jgi:hypothetical protein
MKRKYISFVMLLSAVLAFTSCLSSSDDEVVYTNETAMTAFSLSKVKQYLHKTSSLGTDSIYKIYLSVSKYKFNIDQVNGIVYNPDSLPYGVDASKVLTTVSALNSSYITVKSLTSDSLAYHSSTDSMDFRTPREFRIFSNSGAAYRKYIVHVNVHKEAADSFKWTLLTTTSAIGNLVKMKAVSANGKIYIFGYDGAKTVVLSSAISDGKTWMQSDDTFTATAWQNLAVQGEVVYMLDNGTLRRMKNDAWTALGSTTINALIGASSVKLYALSSSNQLVSSTDEGVTWTAETLSDDASLLPTQDLSLWSLASITNASTNHLAIIGNRNDAAYPSDATAMVWGKVEENATGSENQPWAYYNISSDSKYPAPRLSGLQTTCYDSAILAIGGDGLGSSTKKALDAIYRSSDGGVTFQKDSVISFPSAMRSSTEAFAITTDANKYLWFFSGGTGQVFRGRTNRLGWCDEQKIFTE